MNSTHFLNICVQEKKDTKWNQLLLVNNHLSFSFVSFALLPSFFYDFPEVSMELNMFRQLL